MNDTATVLAQRDRLAAIAEIDLDAPELRRRLDELSARSAAALGLPVGLTTLVLPTAQVLLGASGLPGGWIAEAGGMPVEWAFCTPAVVGRAPYVVEDAPNDPVQHANPLVLVDGVASYAGVPVLTAEGHVLGTHCVLGVAPRRFGEEDLAVLRAGAADAAAVLEEFRAGR